MKKKAYIFVALLLQLFVACGGDNGEDGNDVTDSDLINKALGTWICTQSTDIGQGDTYQGLMVGKKVTINANGSYTSTSRTFGYNGTYTVSGNTITAKSNNGSMFTIIVNITGSSMTWNGTSDNGYSFMYVFTRGDDKKQSGLIGNWLNIQNNEIVNVIAMDSPNAALLMLDDGWYSGDFSTTDTTIVFKVSRFTMSKFENFNNWYGKFSSSDVRTLTYSYSLEGEYLIVIGPSSGYGEQTTKWTMVRSDETGFSGFIIN